MINIENLIYINTSKYDEFKELNEILILDDLSEHLNLNYNEINCIKSIQYIYYTMKKMLDTYHYLISYCNIQYNIKIIINSFNIKNIDKDYPYLDYIEVLFVHSYNYDNINENNCLLNNDQYIYRFENNYYNIFGQYNIINDIIDVYNILIMLCEKFEIKFFNNNISVLFITF